MLQLNGNSAAHIKNNVALVKNDYKSSNKAYHKPISKGNKQSEQHIHYHHTATGKNPHAHYSQHSAIDKDAVNQNHQSHNPYAKSGLIANPNLYTTQYHLTANGNLGTVHNIHPMMLMDIENYAELPAEAADTTGEEMREGGNVEEKQLFPGLALSEVEEAVVKKVSLKHFVGL